MGTKKIAVVGILFVLGLGLYLAFPREVENASKVLSVPKTKQEQTNWCWAGCSSAVFSYYGKKIKQCYIADFAWSKVTCCKSAGPCNKVNSMYGEKGSIVDILKHWCVKSASVASALTFAGCKTEINAQRPFIIRYQWSDGKGHFLVVNGYSTGSSGNDEKLYLMDPGNGSYGFFTYAYVKAKVNHHTWTHTLKSLQKTMQTASWKATNTKPVGSTYSGYPAWKYTLYLTEASGGCGQVVSFYWDFYGPTGSYISRQYNTKEDFAAWFDDCGDGDFQLPRVTKVCSKLWTHLGGQTSGAVKISFVIKCDKGNTITVSRKITLPKYEAPPGLRAGGGQPAVGVVKEER